MQDYFYKRSPKLMYKDDFDNRRVQRQEHYHNEKPEFGLYMGRLI